MKNKRFLSSKMKEVITRIRPRTIVCCVLITVLLVSASIGMGYSKFTFRSDPYAVDYQVKNYTFSSQNSVVLPKLDQPTISYGFLSPDSNVKVAYSKESVDESLNGTEYLVAYFNQEANAIDYTKHARQIDLGYEIGLTGVNRADSLDMVGLKSSVYNSDTDTYDARGIVVYISVGQDADFGAILANLDQTDASLKSVILQNVNPSYSAPSVTGNAAAGRIEFTGIGQLYRMSADDELLNSHFEIKYDKLAWSSYADTDWYDSDPDDAEYWVSTAAELAGLAQIVNSGAENFEGKTVYLNNNISLADVNGYLRRWTPIGTQAHPFKGSFDGHGYTISGLNVCDFGASGDYAAAGLFGFVSGTASDEIKDLTINTAYVSAYLYDDPDAAHPESVGAAGALAGWVEGYTLSGITVKNANLCGVALYGGVVIGRCGAATVIDPTCAVDADCTTASGSYIAVDDIVGYRPAP